MFKGKDDKTQNISNNTPSKLDTLLGQNTKLNGDISFNGVFHLDGTVSGSLVGTQNDDILTISETGVVEGKIVVANIVINGTVKGDITSVGKIEVASKANIEGNVYYNNIEMEAGSKINGQLIYQDKDGANNISSIEEKKSKKD
ncbi:MAG TPA: polymer-forming cytoskeletal protein [Oceanospirillales bacterium]|nr:polymer-forming cytoskeletal protein [Oceanospirillales bacterium]